MNEMPVNNTPAYQEYHPEVIKKYTFSARETIFAYIAAVLGFLSVKLFAAPLFTEGRMGLGAMIFALLLTVYCLIYPVSRTKFTFRKALRIALCISFSVNIFINPNLLIQFLDLIFVLLVLAYDKLADSDERFRTIRRFFPADMFGSLMIIPFAEYGAGAAALKAPAEKSSSGKNIKSALLGLIIAVPATLIVCGLLMSADDNFSRIISSIMNDGFTKVIIFIVQLLIGLPVAFYIFSGCRASEKQLSKELLKDENYEKNLRSVRFLSPVAGVFSALPVCVLYVIFFFSQLSYFLSAFMDKLPSNDTNYSEYARRGFFELCFVSVINLAIILALNLFCKERQGRASRSGQGNDLHTQRIHTSAHIHRCKQNVHVYKGLRSYPAESLHILVYAASVRAFHIGHSVSHNKKSQSLKGDCHGICDNVCRPQLLQH